MRRGLVTAAALALAACGQKSGQPGENQQVASEKSPAATTANSPATAANATRNSNAEESSPAAGLGTLPPANAALRFVGTWATNKANCAAKPWRFTADALTVEGGPHCSFYKVTKAPAGYDIAAQCPTKEPVHTDLINIRFAESARAMLVESNAISPTGLIYCGK